LAAPPERLLLSTDSSCPSAAEVARELTPLLPHTKVELAESAADGEPIARAVIRDEGDKMRVRVGRDERTFNDPNRGCNERVRASAVFIGLILDPPLLPEAAPPPPPPPPPSPPPGRKAAPSEPYVTLELGPVLQAAPVSDAAELPVAGGFGGRLAWGRGLAVALGAAFLLPTRLALPAADARLVWLPFDLSLRASRRTGDVTLSGELGPELALLFASGDRVKNPRTSTRLELGARGAVSLTWGMSQHLGAFLTVFSLWRPRPYEFQVNPGLASGTTPPLWLGASLGLSLRSR
jgi:hypothetical protein